MKGAWRLTWARLRHTRLQTLLLMLCIAVPVLLPLLTSSLLTQYGDALRARAARVPRDS